MNEELKVIISAEIKKLQDAVKKAKTSISDFTKNARDKVNKFGEEFSKIGDKAKTGLAVVGGAVAGAAAALLSLSSSTAEYRTAQAKLNTAFETAGASAGTAKQVYNDLYRTLGDSDVAVEAANHLAQMTTSEKELSEWTTICQGVYATFGDSIPIEGLTEAANETAKVGTVTGTLADALNWAGISEDAFNEKLAACNTEAEREALIRSTLNGVYSEAAANYEKNNASLLAYNEAQAKMAEASARVGEALQPVMTALTTLGADILTALAPYIEQFAAEYLPKITEALAGVGEKIGAVIGWISDNWELISTIGTIVLATAATLAVLSTAVSVVGAVLTFVTSPIALVVAAIAAIIAIIVVCVKYWDEIKAKVVEVASAIWNKVSEMASKVAEFFGNMGEAISTAVSNAKEAAVNKFQEITSGIQEKVSAAKEAVTSKFNEIATNVKQKVTDAKTAAVNKFTEIKTNLSNKVAEAKTAVATKFGEIASTVGTKAGEALTKAQEKFDSIKTAISDAISSAKQIVSDKIADIKSALGLSGFSWKIPKPSFPKFSVSGGQAPWGFMGEGSLPRISISWNAMGGVFENPTVRHFGNSLQGLAENGAEAIVPLENNLGWLDKLAGMLNDRMGGKQPVVLMVDGKVLAQTTIDSINNLTRQTGTLALNLV